MKKAEELIRDYDKIEKNLNDTEREALLKSLCADYEAEFPDDCFGRSALYNELGSFYRHRGRQEESIESFLKAKDLLEQMICVPQAGCKSCFYTAELPDEVYGFREENQTGSVNYANTLNNLAGSYRLAGRLEEAEQLFLKAEEIYETLPDLPCDVVSSGWNNLALVYLDQKRFAKASQMFEKALDLLLPEEGFFYEKATGYANMAAAFYLDGNRNEAEKCIAEADRYYLEGQLEESREYQAFLEFRKAAGLGI